MIRAVKNTLTLEWDRWDDPGDYPSGAGGSRLPGFDFCAGFEGDLVLELTGEDAVAWREWIEVNPELPDDVIDYAVTAVRLSHGSGIQVSKWTWEALESRDGKIVTVTMSPADFAVPEHKQGDAT